VFGAATSLGILCARYRDIGTAIVSGLQFVFFLNTRNLSGLGEGTSFQWILHANPFATLLELVPQPLLSQPVEPSQWLLDDLCGRHVALLDCALCQISTSELTGCDRMPQSAHIYCTMFVEFQSYIGERSIVARVLGTWHDLTNWRFANGGSRPMSLSQHLSFVS